MTDGVHRFISSAVAVTVATKPRTAIMAKIMIDLSCILTVVGSMSGTF